MLTNEIQAMVDELVGNVAVLVAEQRAEELNKINLFGDRTPRNAEADARSAMASATIAARKMIINAITGEQEEIWDDFSEEMVSNPRYIR